MNALEVRGLHVRRGALPVLRGVDLAVPAGRVVGLVGRNGAGKTTTLKAIVGLVPIAAGRVLVGGRDVTHLPPHRRVARGGTLPGYLPEDRRLIPSLTEDENLLLPAWAAGDPEAGARLAELRARMPELAPLGRRLAGTLSGGQQKLVALARALMAGRDLLLLDEPLEGLSPGLSRRLAEVVHGWPGVSVLVTESDVTRIRLLTDHLYTIERGEIV